MFGGQDPFMNMFGNMRRQMDMMDRMMDSMMTDPFAMMNHRPFGMLEDPRRQQHHHQHRQMVHPADPFAGFGFGGIFGAMNQIHGQAMADPNSHMYSHTSVMSFGPDGQPHIVEHTTKKAGDVKETRRRVRDGQRDEMSIGHHIGDRTHVIEKKRDKDGNVRSQQQFVNLDEDEAMDFDREFQQQIRRNFNYGRNGASNSSAIENGSSARPSHSRADRGPRESRHAPIITLPEEEDDDVIEIPITRRTGGPIIREISEEEAESSIPKRRKNNTGRFVLLHYGSPSLGFIPATIKFSRQLVIPLR
ncbi:unnamed protein product, partial [Mesorhabditis spiculigera]